MTLPFDLSWLTFLAAISAILIIPGFLLSLLLFSKAEFSLIERLPVSLVLSIGLFTPMGILAFLYELSLDLALAYLLFITIVLVICLILQLRRRGWHGYKPEFPNVQPATLILFGVLLLLVIVAVAVNLTAPRFSDNLPWLAYIRRYLDLNQVSLEEPFMGTGYIQPRTQLAVWLLLEALIAKLANLNPVPVVRIMIPAFFVVMSSMAFFALAKTLVNNARFAAFATCLQIIAYLGWQFPGVEFFSRLSEDKMVAWFVIFPIVVIFMLRFLDKGGKKNLIGFGLASLGMAVVHPMLFVFCPLALGSLGLLQLLLHRNRKSILRLSTLGGIIVVGLLIPVAQYFEQRAVQGSLFDSIGSDTAVVDRMLNLAEQRSRLLFLPDGSYLAHYDLLLQPITIAGILLAPLLIFWLRGSLSSRFLLANTLLPLALIYNPITAPLLGQVITTGMIYRIVWMVPASLTLAFVLWKGMGRVGELLKRRMLPGTKTLSLTLPLITLLAIGVASASSMYDQHLQRSDADRFWYSSTEYENLFTYMRSNLPPGSTVLADHLLNFFVSAYVNANVVEFRRAVGVYPEDKEAEATQRFKDVQLFYRPEQPVTDNLAILNRYNVDYVVAKTGSPQAGQIAELPILFSEVYSDITYQLYLVRSSKPKEFLIAASQAEEQGHISEAVMELDHYLALAAEGADAEEARRRIDNLVDFDFFSHFSDAEVIAANQAWVTTKTVLIRGEPRNVIFEHPTAQLVYTVSIPLGAKLHFGLGMEPGPWNPWPEESDGAEFLIYVESSQGRELIFSRFLDPRNQPGDRKWFDEEISLAEYSGQVVSIIFATNPGPTLDSEYDWAVWSRPYITVNAQESGGQQ